jgi:P4 family phage/plasmid primase-like protien
MSQKNGKELEAIGEKQSVEEFNNLFRGDIGHADLFIAYNRERIRITTKDGDGYVYGGDTTRLWEKRNADYFYSSVCRFLDQHVRQARIDFSATKDFDEHKMSELSKIQKTVQKVGHAKDVTTLVRSECWNPNFMKDLNRSSHTLPIRGGKVIDLKTLEVRPRMKTDFFDFEIDCDFIKGKTPHADRFFSELMNKRKEVVDYLQVNLGHCMTAEVNQRCIYIFYGEGSNGKSTLCTLLSSILKSFYVPIDKKVMIKTNKDSGNAHTSHIVPLIGARIAVYSESEKNEKLNSSIIKQLTGNDEISCREIYGTTFKCKPVSKYIMLSNYKPVFDTGDMAMVDRIGYVPFNARFTSEPKEGEQLRDHKFIEQLTTTHLSEVFTWLCIGANKYYSYMDQNKPIPIPKFLAEAKNEYINELDNVTQYIKDCCRPDPKGKGIQRSHLYDAYRNWQQANSEGETVSSTEFYRTIEKLGYTQKKSTGIRYVTGLRFANDDEA